MTVNPMKSVSDDRFETALDLGLNAALARIAAFEPSFDAPYLTVMLDWQPEGGRPDVRAGRRVFEDDIETVIERYDAHTPARESLDADVERIKGWLDEVDPSAQGLVVVACNAKGVFETFTLGIPVESEIITGPVPSIRALQRVADDHAAYAVIHADQQEVRLIMVRQATATRSTSIEGSDWPRHQATGGWSQSRFQNAAEQRVANFAKEVAEELRARLSKRGVEQIVLAASEPMASALTSELHEDVREHIVGQIGLDMEATPQDVIEATREMVGEAERKRERDAVQLVQDNRGPGQLAVVGVEDVLTALQSGQVMTLVMNEDFEVDGWADFDLPLYGVGAPPKEHPAGGDASAIVSIPLADEMLRLAHQLDATVELIQTDVPIAPEGDGDIREADEPFPRSEAATALDEIGGVAALLRYAVSEEESVPDTEG